jgi:uncharacterized protein (DUF3820 family)
VFACHENFVSFHALLGDVLSRDILPSHPTYTILVKYRLLVEVQRGFIRWFCRFARPPGSLGPSKSLSLADKEVLQRLARALRNRPLLRQNWGQLFRQQFPSSRGHGSVSSCGSCPANCNCIFQNDWNRAESP